MDWVKVESSNIDSIRYDQAEMNLDVKFKAGEIYRYKEVPKGIYDRLLLAESKGSFLNFYVKKAGYHYLRLDETVDSAEQFADELENTLHDLSGVTFDLLMHEAIKHKLESFAAQTRKECAKAVCSGCRRELKYQEGSHQAPEGHWFECSAVAIRESRGTEGKA